MISLNRKCLSHLTCSVLAVIVLLVASANGEEKDFPAYHSDVYIPISLAVGKVRGAEFSVSGKYYNIIIQAERKLPFSAMLCMMAGTSNPFEARECQPEDPLLRAKWTVWEGTHVVARGISTPSGGVKIGNDRIWKNLGGFTSRRGQRFVVEVEFTKDGTALNIADPHLVVIEHDKFW
jgi:hypothetical protein